MRFGETLADAAHRAGVEHLVYTSSSAAGPVTGVGHFDSKWQVEEHVRGLDIDYTIIRRSTFMEILLEPGFGLADGQLNFFMRPDQAMQFIAVEDIGAIVARVFADRDGHRGRSLEIGGDSATGEDLAAELSRAAGRPIGYQRLLAADLEAVPVLRALARLVDDGPLAVAQTSARCVSSVPGC